MFTCSGFQYGCQLKGLCHEMNIVLKVYNNKYIPTVCSCAFFLKPMRGLVKRTSTNHREGSSEEVSVAFSKLVSNFEESNKKLKNV
jgi:hypothetical protein